jgi:NAD-dependent dihydropyrimidine dehydrogenase PreA subunit
MRKMPVIYPDKCDGCGLCISVCQCKVLVLVGKVVTVVPKNECKSCNTWCTLCEDVCPTGAITCPFDITVEER